MKSTTRIIAIAVIAAALAASVGIAYAYTASISNSDNTAESTFFTMDVDDSDFKSTFDCEIEYDTHTLPGPTYTFTPASQADAEGYIKMGNDLTIDITRSSGNDDVFAMILTPSVSGLTASASEKISGNFAVGYKYATSGGAEPTYSDLARIPMITTSVVSGTEAVLHSTQIPRLFTSDDVKVIGDKSVTRLVISLYLKAQAFDEIPKFEDVTISFKAISDVYPAVVSAKNDSDENVQGAQVTLTTQTSGAYKVAALTGSDGKATIYLPAGTYDGNIQGNMIRQNASCSFTGLKVTTEGGSMDRTGLLKLHQFSVTINGADDYWLSSYVYQYKLSYDGAPEVPFGVAGTLKTIVKAAVGETVTVSKVSGQYDYAISEAQEVEADQQDMDFTVSDKLTVTGLENLTTQSGEVTITISAPEGSTITKLTSSDPSVIKVVSVTDGKIKVNNAGTATIHIEATADEVAYVYDASVTVTQSQQP